MSLSQKRIAQLAIAALKQRLRNQKIPHLNSAEMKSRITQTLQSPELQKLNVTEEELREFILIVLSENYF